MPAVFDRLGVRFQYPDNWTLDDSEASEEAPSVTVYSPDGGAFWSLVVHPGTVSIEDAAAAALDAMQNEYEQLDSEEVEDYVVGHPLVGYDLNFYCLDLTNTALIRSFADETNTYLILCEAEDREYAAVEPVFKAITHSLLS
jgi:hypothetical protein